MNAEDPTFAITSDEKQLVFDVKEAATTNWVATIQCLVGGVEVFHGSESQPTATIRAGNSFSVLSKGKNQIYLKKVGGQTPDASTGWVRVLIR